MVRESSNYSRKLVIGTASWGQNYGLFNGFGATQLEAEQILKVALDYSIASVDTAPSYGNSEEIIGNCHASNLGIFTKVDSLWFERSDKSAYEDLKSSLGRLGVSHFKGLTFHSASSFIRDPSRALRFVSRALDEGLVGEWGVSVYEPGEVEALLEVSTPNYVQAPVSIVDRRFITGDLSAKMLQSSLRLQARSVFLQGLLLNGSKGLPEYFSKYRDVFRSYERIAASAGVSMMSLALMPILHEESVDSLVVGIHDSKQMQDLIDVVFSEDSVVALDLIPRFSDLDLIDPRRWPNFR
jgi:aryl-alcohol dehydrogenase-like predicted oxidoreductase